MNRVVRPLSVANTAITGRLPLMIACDNMTVFIGP
jgi:hypothetical protein